MGGTALALHLGHRQSVHFDFFSNSRFDPSRLRCRNPVSDRRYDYATGAQHPIRHHRPRRTNYFVLISVVGYWFDAAARCGTLRGPATAKYVAAQPLAAARGRATWDHALDRGSHNPPGAPPVTQRVCRNQAEPSLPHNSNWLHSADPVLWNFRNRWATEQRRGCCFGQE